MKAFDDYEVHGIARLKDDAGNEYCEQVPDGEAQLWSLFGHIPGQGLECIGDFPTRQLAEEILLRITAGQRTDAYLAKLLRGAIATAEFTRQTCAWWYPEAKAYLADRTARAA